MHDETMKGAAAAAGLNWDDVKKGLARILPVAETVAKLTPNKFDDAAVAFLKAVLAGG